MASPIDRAGSAIRLDVAVRRSRGRVRKWGSIAGCRVGSKMSASRCGYSGRRLQPTRAAVRAVRGRGATGGRQHANIRVRRRDPHGAGREGASEQA